MTIGSILLFFFGIYLIAVIICSYTILLRAGIMKSMWDLAFEFKTLYPKVMKLKWKVSEFPNINPDDLMLRFVTFSQRRKYIIFFVTVLLIKILSEDRFLLSAIFNN